MEHSLCDSRMYIEGVTNSYIGPYAGTLSRVGGFLVVPMFAFISGWTFYHQSDKSIQKSMSKLKVFLINYWILLTGITVVAVCFCNYSFKVNEIFLEMLTINNNIMIFAWYVFFYTELMLFLPFFAHYAERYSLRKTIFDVLIIIIAVKTFAEFLAILVTKDSFLYIVLGKYFYRYMPIGISGYLCAKYQVIELLSSLFRNYSVSKKLLLMFLCLVFYNHVKIIAAISTGLFLCPIFIALIDSFNIDFEHKVSKIVVFLGRYSMNIWFLHGLFFAVATRQVFQKIGFWFGDPVLSFLWILSISTCLSVIATKFQQFINYKIKL